MHVRAVLPTLFIRWFLYSIAAYKENEMAPWPTTKPRQVQRLIDLIAFVLLPPEEHTEDSRLTPLDATYFLLDHFNPTL